MPLMRFINDLYTVSLGEQWSNERLLAAYEQAISRVSLEEGPRQELVEFVRFQLVGERSRRTVVPDLNDLGDFASRAQFYEQGAEEALSKLAEQVIPAVEAAEVTFDAVITTTSTGNIMPGLSYRMATRLGSL